MHISSIMSKSVTFASADLTVRAMWKLLFASKVNAIPVIDTKKKLMGIVTKEDLLKALYPDYEEYFVDLGDIQDYEAMELKVKEMGSKTAREIMCKRVVYTRIDTPIMRALSRMIARRLNQLPVLDDEDRVVGMVTKGDIFYALFKKNLSGKPANVEEPVKTKKKKAKKR